MVEGTKVVLLVGHCGPDAWMLRSAATRAIPGVAVHMVNSKTELDGMLELTPLLLVNRVLDGKFDSDSGIELIQSLTDSGHSAPAILISNFEDAQAAAAAAGARPGFGKADINSPKAAERMQAALQGGD